MNRVGLLDQTGRIAEAVLTSPLSDDDLRSWEESWAPIMRSFRENLDDHWTPEDSHWDWNHKVSQWRECLIGRPSFSIRCKGKLQGMMLASHGFFARLEKQFNKPILYVDYVATAPWNRPEVSNPPRFRGVGRVFIRAAIAESRESGYKGRLGLHALPAAEHFYGEVCGMTRLAADPAKEKLVYFEMTEEQADVFWKG